MVVTRGASTSGGKNVKPNKQGKGSEGKQRKKPLQLAFGAERSTLSRIALSGKQYWRRPRSRGTGSLDLTTHDVRHQSKYKGKFFGGCYGTKK